MYTLQFKNKNLYDTFINDERIKISLSISDYYKNYEKYDNEIFNIILSHVKNYEEINNIQTNISIKDIKHAYLNIKDNK